MWGRGVRGADQNHVAVWGATLNKNFCQKKVRLTGGNKREGAFKNPEPPPREMGVEEEESPKGLEDTAATEPEPTTRLKSR